MPLASTTAVASPRPRCDLAAPPSYARRRPEDTALYAIIRDHRAELLAHARSRSEHGAGYPRFVERELARFLDCGILDRGFARVRCGDCAAEHLVAFSCKTRGICPSCTARRMADTAAHLVDRVLPPVPFRQWVLSLPRRVRFALARYPRLLSDALGVFVRKVSAWQRRRARAHGIAAPHTGAVTFVQRFGSLLNLNCHFHTLFPDGVFAETADGRLEFVPLPPPTDRDVDRILGQVARAIHRLVDRRLAVLDHDDLEDDGLVHDQRDALGSFEPSWAHAPPARNGRLSAFLAGYSLHAARAIADDQRDALERLCRYGARAPIANERLARNPDGTVVITLRKPLRDGRTVLRFSPLELLRRLVTLIPPPRANLTRYHGVFAPNHHLRSRVVDLGRAEAPPGDEPPAPRSCAPRPPRRRLDWASLLRRVFAIDVLRCDTCGGTMRILAVLCEGDATRAILDHLARRAAPPPHRALDPPGTAVT